MTKEDEALDLLVTAYGMGRPWAEKIIGEYSARVAARQAKKWLPKFDGSDQARWSLYRACAASANWERAFVNLALERVGQAGTRRQGFESRMDRLEFRSSRLRTPGGTVFLIVDETWTEHNEPHLLVQEEGGSVLSSVSVEVFLASLFRA
jgi:hypothetical protein